MLNITVEEKKGAIIISLAGDLNLDSASKVEKAFYEQFSLKPRVIGMDCKGLKSLDSSGLGLFIKLSNSSRKEGLDLVFFNLSGNVSSLFDMSQVDKYFLVMTHERFKDEYLG